MQIQFKMLGVEQALKNMAEIGGAKSRAASRRALTSASSQPLKAAKQNAPVETGLLKKSLGKKPKTYPSGTNYVVIGPRSGFKDPDTGRNPAKYAHLVEFGTTRASAKPFLRPAIESTKDGVFREYQVKLWEGLNREILRMKK